MEIKLYLDDMRTPIDSSWNVVRNYDEFVEFIGSLSKEQQENLVISFDHDLADEHYTPSHYWDDYYASKRYQESQTYVEKTGYDCAKYITDNDIVINKYYVHSMNPVGADNIIGLLDNYYKVIGKNIRGTKTFWEHTIYE